MLKRSLEDKTNTDESLSPHKEIFDRITDEILRNFKFNSLYNYRPNFLIKAFIITRSVYGLSYIVYQYFK